MAVERGIELASLADLSASLNPFAPDVAALLATRLAGIRRYPDDETAHRAVAAAFGIERDEVLLTNGGAEAIALVAQHLGRIGIVPSLRESDFSLYRRHLESTDPMGPLFASNPSSPEGRLTDPYTAGVCVWDEAFWPLATGTWTSGIHRRGVIVTGSFTKVFACPGLRLGYVLAAPELIGVIAHDRPRWSVSTIAADLLPVLLQQAQLPEWRDAVATRRAELVNQLNASGFEARPGVNWVLARRLGWSAAQLRAALLDHGVLVRDCASFGLPDTIRIALPTTSEQWLLTAAIKSTAAAKPPTDARA